jgi:hypothetical protein
MTSQYPNQPSPHQPSPPSWSPQHPTHISREQQLDEQIASYLTKGWRIESRTDHSAVLVKGKRVNHLLHLVLSLVTFGLWLPVWLIVAIAAGEKREHLAA